MLNWSAYITGLNYNSIETQNLSTSCRRNDGTSKANFHFDDQSEQVDFLFGVPVFSKGNTKHCSFFNYKLHVD